jgi:BolA family transcriptional regulator, general stress-responsive regulator
VNTQEWLRETLTRALAPSEIRVDDESHQHAGHAGSRPGGETHFRIDVVSDRFVGKSRVERHRMVNELAADAFTSRGLHALAIRARAPGE